MDLSDIKRQAEAAREFDHPIGKAVFKLRLPTPYEAREAIADGTGSGGSASGFVVRGQRALTLASIIGWSGITVADLFGEHKHGTDEVPYEPAAVGVVLDQRDDWSEDIWLKALLPKLEARDKAAKATAKNSQRASPGAATRPVRETSTA